MEQSPSYYAELEVKLEAVLKEKAVLERELSEAVGCNQVMLTTYSTLAYPAPPFRCSKYLKAFTDWVWLIAVCMGSVSVCGRCHL